MSDDPLVGYQFVVTLDFPSPHLPPEQAILLPPMVEAGFQEVSGLSAELEVMAYPEGGENGYVHQLPVRHSWGRLTLKRGLVLDLGLWFWYQAGLTHSLGARRDGTVMLKTPAGVPAVAWHFQGGLAVKWMGPNLSAKESAVAIEGIEIAHEGITQIPLLL